MTSSFWILLAIAAVLAVGLVVALVVVIAFPIGKGLWHVLKCIGRFIGREFTDLLRFLGAAIAGIVLLCMAGVNAILLRRARAGHYLEGAASEGAAAGAAVYRFFVGNVVRLCGAEALTEGIERRVPKMLETAPTVRLGVVTPSFAGYRITGSLRGGGSGAKLYLAKPDAKKLAKLQREGHAGVVDVVIKSFSLDAGSTLPQIVRESRAIPAASALGLILEHELTESRFYYVTRYVPGELLSHVVAAMHARAGAEGLDEGGVREALGYVRDLLQTLGEYHAGGLWHKDVKPDNLIVTEEEGSRRARLVDFGLVSPLASAMTLTTHGTEYFRDPEMVKLALKGAKVQDADGAKFDVYAAGAVLYSMIENTFPAHGGLSRVTKRCPEAVSWIIRRAMAEYDRRYATAGEMRADVEAVLASGSAYAMRIAELPSVRAGAPSLAGADVEPAA